MSKIAFDYASVPVTPQEDDAFAILATQIEIRNGATYDGPPIQTMTWEEADREYRRTHPETPKSTWQPR